MKLRSIVLKAIYLLRTFFKQCKYLFQVRNVVGILHCAKARSIRPWLVLDSRITEAANEAKDNVKYLYTLEKYFGPLSKCDPLSLVEIIPSLMNSVRMIHSVSQYYNTSERMTSLFVKVGFCVLNLTDKLKSVLI